MTAEKTGLIDIDRLQQQTSVQQVAQYYGVSLAIDAAAGGEQRIACPCSDCSGNGDTNSVSINLSDPMKRWKCHRESYGCGAQGRLVMLAYCWKHGSMPPGGKLSGRAFFDIAKDFQAMSEGRPRPESPPPATADTIATEQTATRDNVEVTVGKPANIPLASSENPAARKLVNYQDELTIELDRLTPAAGHYARRRPFLLSEPLAQEMGTGYMPGDAKSSLRHNWVYPVHDRQHQLLALVGRNVNYETNHEKWIAEGRHGKEPIKYRFPTQKNFLRGIELAGQQWLDDPRFTDSLNRHGLLLVEGFTDYIRLHAMQVLGVAMMSNRLTEEQTELLVDYAKEKAHNRVGIMHDADAKGDEGAKESLWRLQEAGVDAYLVWSRKKFEGAFADRQPESLTETEWQAITKELS